MAKNEVAAKPASKAKKDKKGPGLKERISKFFRTYISELKKITWPTGKQVLNNTIITIVAVLIVGLFIWLFDFGLQYLREWIFNQF
ncbi:MAG: preprotein translocase subunit SecE [Clostridia bacterium]|nr:preprotein translocase subunit SecE [Clostridia bacterium]MBQ6570135.1 preprotein translocase subunit SecE [Clostridia bacterium]